MNIISWRIVSADWAHAAFTGEGGLTHSSRWNKKGTRIIYTASSLSLATLEVLVNVPTRLIATKRYLAIAASFNEKLVQRVRAEDLPPNWSQYPATFTTKELGTLWIEEGKSAVLAVPSSLIPNEINFLFNPSHPDFCEISIGKPENYRFDERLLTQPTKA
ncbi:MAG: RES family NAD+ phosphorylase [Desulfobacterales bacterium]